MASANRRQEILQAFAAMLEEAPGSRITTAAIARQVGVSEAALYRHFPSKAKMLEALIEFVEESLFPRIHRIAEQTLGADEQCRQILTLVLTFAERNPGFMRLLSGDILQGETARLRSRVRELFDRLEAEIRQVLRDAESPGRLAPTNAANLLLAYAEGRIAQFVRSDFTAQPTNQFRHHWPALRVAVFGDEYRVSAN
ncbi:MAG: nucleoid occlusion factor SlmA [Gammaproteobacteria bacterium]|nr:nucleoid occlusion factor SlmA [Gammaproteobacteria bacterium]